jgi:hypothetical protein
VRRGADRFFFLVQDIPKSMGVFSMRAEFNEAATAR